MQPRVNSEPTNLHIWKPLDNLLFYKQHLTTHLCVCIIGSKLKLFGEYEFCGRYKRCCQSNNSVLKPTVCVTTFFVFCITIQSAYPYTPIAAEKIKETKRHRRHKRPGERDSPKLGLFGE